LFCCIRDSEERKLILSIGYSDALTAYHDTNSDPSTRPEKYESKPTAAPAPAVATTTAGTTGAWGKSSNGIISAWGQQSQTAQQQTQKAGKKKKKGLRLLSTQIY
jgi:hypothetical protein